MSSIHKNLSSFDPSSLPSAKGKRFAIVVSAWNFEVTDKLYMGARETLIRQGVKEDDLIKIEVPGSYELPLGALKAYELHQPDAVICIGCIIQGETRHFDFIAQSVSDGIMELNLKYKVPFIFGVLTPNTMEQAMDRAGGKHGNKGIEAAVTAIYMSAL